jgi:hypothetical protein
MSHIPYGVMTEMMILSVAEYVVRRELKVEDEQIIGPGDIKMKGLTLWAILEKL